MTQPETAAERRSRQETHAARRWEEERRAQRPAPESQPAWRRWAPLVLVLVLVATLITWGLAGRGDAYGQRHLTSTNSGVFYDRTPVYSIPDFFVRAQWGFGVVCITSAGLANPSSGPWIVAGEDYSKACIGPFAEARVLLYWPNNGAPFAALYRITINYLGGYNVGYDGPGAEPPHNVPDF